jgi:hypothetical protein
LEKKVKQSDTRQNKINLADEYVKVKRYAEAADLYESSLEDYNHHNVELSRKLVEVMYQLGDYDSAVFYGEEIVDKTDFSNSEQRICYAWALYELDKLALAEENFQEMNQRFTNYLHRIQYAKFLSLTGRTQQGLDLLDELLTEYEQMDSAERKMKRGIQTAIHKMFREIQA